MYSFPADKIVLFLTQHIDFNLPHLADRSMTLRHHNYVRNTKLIKLQMEQLDSFWGFRFSRLWKFRLWQIWAKLSLSFLRTIRHPSIHIQICYKTYDAYAHAYWFLCFEGLDVHSLLLCTDNSAPHRHVYNAILHIICWFNVTHCFSPYPLYCNQVCITSCWFCC